MSFLARSQQSENAQYMSEFATQTRRQKYARHFGADFAIPPKIFPQKKSIYFFSQFSANVHKSVFIFCHKTGNSKKHVVF